MKVAEIVLSGGMVGTTEVEERQDLYRFTLKEDRGGRRQREKKIFIYLLGSPLADSGVHMKYKIKTK